MEKTKLYLLILLQAFNSAFLKANERTDRMTGAWFQMCNDKKASVSITKIKEDVYYVMHYDPEVFYGESSVPGIFVFAEYGHTYKENKIKLTTMIGGKEQYFCLFLDDEKLYVCENFEELVYPYNETAYPYHRIEYHTPEEQQLLKTQQEEEANRKRNNAIMEYLHELIDRETAEQE